MRPRIALLIGLLLALALPSGFAHADEPVTVAVIDVDDSAFPEVQAIVSIVEGGRPARLQPGDLVATETAAPADVLRIQAAEDLRTPLSVIVTIDTSGSMQGAKIAAARSAAATFVRSLQTWDHAAVFSFGSEVRPVAPLTSDHAATVAAITALTTRGDTALYTAVAESLRAARESHVPRRAVVLLSDGREESARTTLTREEVLAQVALARVPFYVVGLGEDIDRAFLSDLAGRSGGRFLEAPTAAGVEGLYQEVSQLLRGQFVVTLRSTAAADIAERSLRLNVNTALGTAQTRFDYRSRRAIDAGGAPEVVVPQAGPRTGGQASVLLPLVLLLVSVAVVVGGVLLVRAWRRGRGGEAQAQRSLTAAEELRTTLHARRHQESRPVVLSIEGPGGESRVEITRQPVTIGHAASCEVRLPSASGLSPEHARLWLQEGKLIFHQLSPAASSLLGDRPVTWASLEAGEEIKLGPYTLQVVGDGDADG
jgi:tight adherence protein B